MIKRIFPTLGRWTPPPKPGKVEPVKADSPVQDQPTPARAGAPATEDASKVVTPLTAEKPVEGKTAPDPTGEQPALGGKEASNDKDIPAPSKEGAPPGKDEKQTTIPGMGDPAPAGKVVDFTAAREGVVEGKTPEKAAAPDKGKQADKTKDAAKPRRGRPPKADKAAPDEAQPPKPRDKVSQGKKAATVKEAPAPEQATAGGGAGPGAGIAAEPQTPTPPPRPVEEGKLVYLKLSELHPFHTFRPHPFKVTDDAKMQETVASIKANGVMVPGLARPEKDGNGFEIIAGHRRTRGSELAGLEEMPFIVRDMTDQEAVQAMRDSNKQRDQTLPSELAALLDLEVEAIKHQGGRLDGVAPGDVGKRSVEIVGEAHDMNYKKVMRYLRLNSLVPELLNKVDEKGLGFMPAVELSYIKPKNQRLIAVSIDGEQSSPSHAQAKRLRELDQAGKLNGDVIDGILSEKKKEDRGVIISMAELEKYFGKEVTPIKMKEQIMSLLDEWKEKQPPELKKPEKKADLEK